jgi:lysozyme
MERRFGEAARAMAKAFEGLRLTSYQDEGGVWTVGWGHTGVEARDGATMNEDAAEVLLGEDLERAARCVDRLVKVEVSQNQFDALVDFCFNLGCASLAESTLLKMVNAGDWDAAATQFLRWNKAGGKVLRGLTKRRQAEAELFRKADRVESLSTRGGLHA